MAFYLFSMYFCNFYQNSYCQQTFVKQHTIDKKDQRLIYFNQRLIDFNNCWLGFQSTVDKIYQPLIEIYQPLIFFINGMLFDIFCWQCHTVMKFNPLNYLLHFSNNFRNLFQNSITFKTILWELWASYSGLLNQNNLLKVLIKSF